MKNKLKISNRKDFNNPEFLEERCSLLREFCKEYGHCRVPVDSYKIKDVHLGRWVSRMRAQHHKGNLPEKVVKKLESVKGWVWRAKGLNEEDTFQKHLKCLKNYIKNNGSLDTWDTDLKRHFDYIYSRKKAGTIPAKRIKYLESLPGWSWHRKKENWMKKYRNLKSNHEEILSNPPTYTIAGVNAASWINQQRYFYKVGKLNRERINLLEEIPGWLWKERENNDVQWMNWYKLLEDYTKVNSTSDTTMTEVYKEHKLGSWCGVQRGKYKGRIPYPLTNLQINLLEKLPGWSWQTSRFNRYIDALKEYIEEFGHTLIPKNYRTADGRPLGIWVSRQRTYYRRKQLSEDKIFKLLQIPNWVWNRTSIDWDDYYHAVRNDASIHGFRIKKRTEIDNLKVGNWVYRQRASFRKGSLSKDKINLLESIPGWWWSKQN